MTLLAPIGVTATSFCKSEALRSLATRELAPREVRFGNGNSRATEDDVIKLLKGCVGAIVGRESINDSVLAKLSDLKAIAIYGVGTDNIDFAACRAKGVDVLVAPGANAPAAAEHTIGLMLAVLRNIGPTYAALKSGVWTKDGGVNLTGKRIAIVGVGAIGSRVARLLKAFECELLLVDILDKSSFARSLGARQVSYGDAIRDADVVSFHVPLTDLTRKMLDAKALATLKPSAVVINTSRGEVIDQTALVNALRAKSLRGAGLDVFESEPIVDRSFWETPGLVGTPHTAGNSLEAVWAMGTAAVTLLKDRLK